MVNITIPRKEQFKDIGTLQFHYLHPAKYQFPWHVPSVTWHRQGVRHSAKERLLIFLFHSSLTGEYPRLGILMHGQSASRKLLEAIKCSPWPLCLLLSRGLGSPNDHDTCSAGGFSARVARGSFIPACSALCTCPLSSRHSKIASWMSKCMFNGLPH